MVHQLLIMITIIWEEILHYSRLLDVSILFKNVIWKMDYFSRSRACNNVIVKTPSSLILISVYNVNLMMIHRVKQATLNINSKRV